VKKLVALSLFGLVVVIGLTALLARNASEAGSTLDAVKGFTNVRLEAQEIRLQMIAMSDAMRGFLLNPSNQAEFDKKKKADAALSAAVTRLLASASSPEYSDLARQIGKLDEDKLDPIEDRILDLAAHDAKAATHSYFNDYLPVRLQQLELVDRLQTLATGAYDAEVRDSAARTARVWTLAVRVGGTLIVLMIAAFAWSAWTTRMLSARISQQTAALADTAGGVLRAAGELSGSSQALSQGATEQAASLEETSASMEEMASMTRKNADNSQAAAGLMGQVEGLVQQSNTALTEMVASMAAIQASSQEVGKIIKRIDEIAFQTNILALNAAVEAARAGEAGMGFAVVADEVRNLAQRSAQAAKDTAGLIESSIQKAQSGDQTVKQVATSIAAITDSVTKVRGLVDEVSAASRQQSQGVDQVAQAIAQMEKVTQTTAATAEESAAASEELNAQAATAMDVVRQLERLVGSAAAAPAAKNTRTPGALMALPARRPAAAHSPAAAEDLLPLGDTGTYGRF
jgi:methyl-accepting chemotaxis protein/methyl-accepting chemotaxis protein-1 (serine sensor receptor)